MSDHRHLRTAIAVERGDTLIEIVFSILILALVIAAASTLFAHGEHATAGDVTESQLIAAADQQIETIRDEVKTEGFDALAMSSVPAHTASAPLSIDANTQSAPSYFVDAGSGCGVAGAGYDIEANWDDTSEGFATGVSPWSGCTNTASTIAEPLEVISGGFVSPAPQTVTLGGTGATATVSTYVTDTYLGCLNNPTSTPACPTLTGTPAVSVSGCMWPTTTTASTTCADARRVIVAVALNTSGAKVFTFGQLSPVYISTVFSAPTPSNAPGGTAGITLGLQLG